MMAGRVFDAPRLRSRVREIDGEQRQEEPRCAPIDPSREAEVHPADDSQAKAPLRSDPHPKSRPAAINAHGFEISSENGQTQNGFLQYGRPCRCARAPLASSRRALRRS